MGDENTILTEAEARHLLRRTGFGPTRQELDNSGYIGSTRGAAADDLLDFKPKKFKPSGREFDRSHDKWIKFMTKTRHPIQSKLVLFWHDHFATAISTVQDVKLMAIQIRLLYTNSKGNFKDLVKAINIDTAMMEFLDTVRNRKQVPNENYARELQELFTLGVTDFAGNENYTQEDIVQISRAFTGWDYEKAAQPFLNENRHDFMEDFPERGPKVIFKGAHGFPPGGADFTTSGEGAAEINVVTDILFQHTDTDGKNTVARRTAARLIEYFAHPDLVTPSLVDAVVADSGFDTNWDISALCRAIFVRDEFYATAAPAPFGGGTLKSVKWPIDYTVSTLRVLRVKLRGRDKIVDGGTFRPIRDHLQNMGQLILDPPSVFGWDWESAWLSSSTLLARYNFARDIVAAREGGKRFRPETLMDLSLTDPGQIADAVLDLLGVSNQLTASERQALIDYLTDSGLNASLDLLDDGIRNTKLHGLFALVMQSPAYQVH